MQSSGQPSLRVHLPERLPREGLVLLVGGTDLGMWRVRSDQQLKLRYRAVALLHLVAGRGMLAGRS
jgi:hypothetical protein